MTSDKTLAMKWLTRGRRARLRLIATCLAMICMPQSATSETPQPATSETPQSAMEETSQPASPKAWVDYLTSAYDYLTRKQAGFKPVIESSPQYFYDQDLGTIAFCKDGKPEVIAKILVVGSTSISGGTWLWSWANESIVPELSQPLTAVRDVGHERGFEKLTEALWEADEVDGWEMTSVSAQVLQADAAYRSPHDNGALFLLLFEPRPAAETKLPARCE